jgi:hypothetical protein
MQLLPKAVTQRVTIKNVKENFGHDLGGFFCDIYLDNKKVAYLNNDGWGGCPDVRPYGYDEKYKERMSAFEQLIMVEARMPEFQAEDYNNDPRNTTMGLKNDWSAKDFGFDSVVEFICERLNFLKSINRQQKKAILFGNPRGGSYKLITYKYAIEDLKKTHSGILKAKVLEIQSKLEKGECIFNTNLEGIL